MALRGLLAGLIALLAGTVAAAEPGKQVAAYRAEGYTIAGKQEEERSVPGKPPYEQLKRVVHVTTYRLERGAEKVVCEVTYDSQLDTIATLCK